MNLSPTAQATLLLTSYFSKSDNKEFKPLTNLEWGRFALWLKEKNINPADLLVPDPASLIASWHDKHISQERILALLNRGHSLALALEKWQRAGLWVMTRSDADYPIRLKSRLKTNSPPVLFGCGNRELLNKGGIAVVGSRAADEADLEFTLQLGKKAAVQNLAIVSGGARGIDEASMRGAMEVGGEVIGVLADSLLKAATAAKWRKGLMDGNVVLISPFYPEAGFNTGNAMARNKYIYCLADTSVVVHSGKKGGTFNGALENLKEQWVPLWVKPTLDKEAANAMLVQKGGEWCSETVAQIDLLSLYNASRSSKETSDLFSQPNAPVQRLSDNNQSYKLEIGIASEDSEQDTDTRVTFYLLFVTKLSHCATEPTSADELAQSMGLHKLQVAEWLKKAVDDGYVRKLPQTTKYQYLSGRH